MFDIKESEQLYLELMLQKAQRMVNKIKSYWFVKDAYLVGQGIKIEFNVEVELGDQDVLGLFLRGGVIKRVKSKDNTEEVEEDDFLLIDPIGEF